MKTKICIKCRECLAKYLFKKYKGDRDAYCAAYERYEWDKDKECHEADLSVRVIVVDY